MYRNVCGYKKVRLAYSIPLVDVAAL